MLAMNLSMELIRTFFATYKARELHDSSLTHAGVLVLLFRKGHELHLLLTKRTDEVEHHKGQISFPGGAANGEDANIEATALREAEEEIGLPASAVEVLGRFDDISTPTGFLITPVVGYVHSIPALALNSEEVVEVIEVPLSFFLEKRNERFEKRVLEGKVFDVCFYDFGRHVIWGATAKIIRSILSALVENSGHLTKS